MTHHHPIRDHLRSLLASRRVSFHTQVVIHDIINVPLVQGDFAVRWRFDNAQSVQSGDNHHSKHKKKEDESSGTVDDSSEQDSIRNGRLTSSSSSTRSSTDAGHQLQLPRHGSNDSQYGRYLSPDAASSATTPIDNDLEVPKTFLSSARGKTELSPLLHDHSILYNQRIDVELEMSIDRETRELQPCELKLEVLLNLPSDDPKENGKQSFGVAYIDLAQYARAGAETRRHLLQKSKTNALIRVSIELTQTGGDSNYIAPSLPTAQLLSGVAGLLDRERSLVQQVNLETKRGLSDSPSARSPPRPPAAASRRPSHSGASASSSLSGASTEAIINALFNPYPTSSSVQSPFTYPAPPRSTTSTPSSLSGSESFALDRSANHRAAEAPRVPAATLLAPLAKFDSSLPKRKDVTDPNDKRGRWWKLGSNSRPTTPAHTLSAESDHDAVRLTSLNPKAFSASTFEDRTARKPPAIAVTDADQRQK